MQYANRACAAANLGSNAIARRNSRCASRLPSESKPVHVGEPEVIAVPSIQVLCRLPLHALALDGSQFRLDSGSDHRGDLVLYHEDVREIAVPALGPDVIPRCSIN